MPKEKKAEKKIEKKIDEDSPKYKNVIVDGEEKIQITFPDGKKRLQSL